MSELIRLTTSLSAEETESLNAFATKEVMSSGTAARHLIAKGLENAAAIEANIAAAAHTEQVLKTLLGLQQAARDDATELREMLNEVRAFQQKQSSYDHSTTRHVLRIALKALGMSQALADSLNSPKHFVNIQGADDWADATAKSIHELCVEEPN